jgi:hypothetical protein
LALQINKANCTISAIAKSLTVKPVVVAARLVAAKLPLLNHLRRYYIIIKNN